MYTQDLINEVKELYPNDKAIHAAAEQGNAFLGRYLDDSSPTGLPLDEILLATSLQQLQDKARMYKRRVELYKKWCAQDPRPKINSY